MIEKAKLLADELGVPEDKLYFSSKWLQKFKKRNGICQIKLHREADFVDENVITESLPLLQRFEDECFISDLVYHKGLKEDDLCEADDLRLENLIRLLNILCLSNIIETDEFLNFNGEEIVYKVFLKDQIIKKLAYVFRNNESIKVMDEGNTEIIDEEKDNSIEPAVVSGSSALNSLKNVQMFLL
ncbi:16079_t:CDS:2 [Cetraspora pellucida]|uniref:16079_t:CDS:1 n=1 Tax=Cetraspora pellucida TaxID=1433469 RepID=A0A9N8W7I7_9GLOM|nr:16079_t:CDS:2 [Cetraspora pellucida]